ncbi:glucoamylase family protein [Mesorhizobium sp. BAC0120]|uniref:glucoamylase family protein n=1 Tax=Mesorhizobium sp. BAC0120 TaxID=3090670 RepID=UPI00298C473B|nr:glucoamylase family protein [Mesorhizobium sp. BAC0120]MDW6023933.1 glucoamylase family protein [Mesorhizobium sp. BAC0120]
MPELMSLTEIHRQLTDEDWRRLQFTTLMYYIHATNPDNGLVRDRTEQGAPASIAAIGMAMASVPVIVERDIMVREYAGKLTRRRLQYLIQLPQGPEPDASGYKGFFYHFLDMENGHRVWQCELSTIDSAFLFAGALTAATYFDRDTPEEVEIRQLATELYERADWNWARDGGVTLTHGWRPESGFIPYRWRGYDEGLLLYFLGLGSPTHPLPPESYAAYTETYEWKKIYGRELLYSGPLFTHQLSHMWVDFRGIRDAFMREHDSDYFENSRQATFVQQEYAIHNPMHWAGYGKYCWGFSASDGPGWVTREVNGVKREFFDYIDRGAPFGPDDGTVAPWAVVASMPFAPEIVIPTARNFARMDLGATRLYGFKPSFNRSFAVEDSPTGWWVTPCHFGIDQGPVVLMVENYRTGLLWKIMHRCQPLVAGLRRAGFSGGWLEAAS